MRLLQRPSARLDGLVQRSGAGMNVSQELWSAGATWLKCIYVFLRQLDGGCCSRQHRANKHDASGLFVFQVENSSLVCFVLSEKIKWISLPCKWESKVHNVETENLATQTHPNVWISAFPDLKFLLRTSSVIIGCLKLITCAVTAPWKDLCSGTRHRVHVSQELTCTQVLECFKWACMNAFLGLH